MASSLFGGGGGGYPWNPIYGSRVKPISVPGLPAGPTLGTIYPNLSGTNAATSSALLSELQGQLSPETIAAIRDNAATFGVTSGMPGSGLQGNRGLRDLGLMTEQLQHQGLGDYSSIIPTVSATQTVNPQQQAQLQANQNQLQTEIGAYNATNAAAPDPTAAGTYAQQLFQQYLNRESAPSSGSGGKPWWQTEGEGNDSGWTSNLGSYDWVTNPRYA